MQQMIRVALCDDNSLVRESLASYLTVDPDLQLVASYSSGQDLLTDLPGRTVDVLLLDVRMPTMDGPAVARELRRLNVRCKIVYLSSYPDDIPVRDALNGTVMGALTKDVPPDDLARAIHLVAAGTGLLSRQVRDRAAEAAQPRRRDSLARDEKEHAVLDLLCTGYTNDQIASRLQRSSSSVKQILGTLCRRAGVNSRTELILYIMDATFPARQQKSPDFAERN